jgi:arylsulfatase A-like enzyme
VLVTLDTTRADHLELFGYARPTSPNLTALGAESVVYERAYSTSSWTLPGHASLFTGKYPSSHGARHDPEGSLVLASAIDAPTGIRARSIGRDERTLASLLRGAGFSTGGVVAGPWMLRVFGLAHGFDHWDDRGIRDAVGRRARDVSDAALAWLAGAREPFFLFLNYFDPHVPYAPPRAWARSFLPPGVAPDPLSQTQAVDLYDAEILYMDHELGRVFDALRARGLWERTLVVVTADHGELLGDRGGEWGHERWLWEPLVRVPLVVKSAGPARAGRRERELVSLVDVLPLVLRELGLEAPGDVQGGAPPDAERPLLAEERPMSPESGTGEWRARWDGRFKYLESSRGERFLFDLERDPAESENLAPREPERASDAASQLERDFAALPPAPPDPGPVALDAATVEALRALGYLGEGAGGADQRSQTRIDSSE